MNLETVFTPQFFTQTGTAGILFYIAIRSALRIYTDMRKDKESTDNNITNQLVKVSLQLDKVSTVLDKSIEKLESMEYRIGGLERRFNEVVRKGDARNI